MGYEYDTVIDLDKRRIVYPIHSIVEVLGRIPKMQSTYRYFLVKRLVMSYPEKIYMYVLGVSAGVI